MNGIEHNITQFADDITSALDASEDSPISTFNTLKSFLTISRMRMNTHKAKLAFVGESNTK